MSWQPTRDFTGYGANPPDPKWPGGARIADQSMRRMVSTDSTRKPSVWPLYSESIMIGATSSVSTPT